MGAAHDPVLVATGLVKRYGPRAPLAGIDLALRAGETALLLGGNGSGKTTLLRVLATIERPDSGALAVAGVDALDDGAAARGRLGHAGHEPGLYPALTVRENLAFVARFRLARAEARAAVVDALSRFALDAVADARAGGLSRGTRQRAALARAFLGAPRVLLLDEPWTGLDAGSADRLDAAIAEAAAGGAAVLAATHDAARLPRARRVRLSEGRLEAAH